MRCLTKIYGGKKECLQYDMENICSKVLKSDSLLPEYHNYAVGLGQQY